MCARGFVTPYFLTDLTVGTQVKLNDLIESGCMASSQVDGVLFADELSIVIEDHRRRRQHK